MTEIHLFGLRVPVSEFWLFILIVGGATLWSGNELRRAATTGKIGFKGREYSRYGERFEYWLYVIFWSVIFGLSILGAIGWYFDLGRKP